MLILQANLLVAMSNRLHSKATAPFRCAKHSYLKPLFHQFDLENERSTKRKTVYRYVFVSADRFI